MVVYNELVAVTAGAGLLGVAALLWDLLRGKRVVSEGWAAFFGVTGLILFSLGLHTTVTWPFGGGGFEYANIAFGQPALAFGVLLLFAAIFLWRHREIGAMEGDEARTYLLGVMRPVGIFIGALGLAMAVLAFTFVRFQLGAAPPEEPISGRFGHLPILEAIFLGGLWGIVALGAILLAIVVWAEKPNMLKWAVWAIALGGLGYLLFGAMNFYTHIGMYYNIAHNTNILW